MNCGIYAIINRGSAKAYIGQSRNIHKRILEHQRLLRLGSHPNQHLQNAWTKHGEQAFEFEVVISCDDPLDLDAAESPFLIADAIYEGCSTYNIAKAPQAAMAGRQHSAETKATMSTNRKGKVGHVTPEYRAKLSAAQMARYSGDIERNTRIKKIIDLVDGGSPYAEAGRVTGFDTSTARKLYLKYKEILF